MNGCVLPANDADDELNLREKIAIMTTNAKDGLDRSRVFFDSIEVEEEDDEDEKLELRDPIA